MPKHATGVNKHKAPGTCMVVDCARKALYRVSSHNKHKDAGYCAEHRDLARPRDNFALRQQDWASAHVSRRLIPGERMR